jgi:glycosyltransferase involved in cell wall biosynthesis
VRRNETTVIVEPDPDGHRFQAVANVAEVAARRGDVVLLTSQGATALEAFEVFLADAPITAIERYSGIQPPTREMAEGVAEVCREREVGTVAVIEADKSLKRWWYAAPLAFRGLGKRKPRVVFTLLRYPAHLGLRDSYGWKLRITKVICALLAMATRSLHHVAGFAGRDDMSRGWIVKRTRDPEICTAHSRDRKALREELGLDPDRTMVGIYGVISERKNAPLVMDALESAGIDADLVLAGGLEDPVRGWVAGLDPERKHLVVRDGFLSNEELDKYIAVVDAIPIPLTNNGPSGIMGKALAAEVPVVTAGSMVRAREIGLTGGGLACDLDAVSIGQALKTVLAQRPEDRPARKVPPATAEEFSLNLLGWPHA